MMKFIKRLIYIVLGGGGVWGFSKGRLSDIPVIQYSILGAWVLLGGTILALIGKRRSWWILCLVFGLNCFCVSTSEASWFDDLFGNDSASVSSYYQTYCNKIENARKNKWQGDEACDKDQWKKAREITAQQTKTADEKTEGCSCSSTDGGYDCAAKLMKLCSEYEKRHPSKDVHTVLEILSNQESGCWPCDMAVIIFTVIQNLSFTLYDMMTEVAVLFLEILFIGWLSFAGLSAVVFPSDGMTFPGRVLQRLLVVMFTYLVLTSDGMTALYNGILNPIMSAGLGLSQTISESATSISSDRTFNEQLETAVTKKTGTDYCASANAPVNPVLDESETIISGGINFSNGTRGNGPDIVLYNIGYTEEENLFANASNLLLGSTWGQKLLPSSNKNNTLLTDSMKVKLLCMTQKFYHQGNPFVALGQSLVEFSTKDSEPNKFLSKIGIDVRFPDPLAMYFVGLFFVIFFTIFSFLIAFKIMDIFLRLAFFLVLMPLFVASVVFPFTRDFAKKGWNFFLHTVIEFLALALAIVFIMQMMESFLKIDDSTLLQAMKADYSDKYGENLLAAVYTDGGCRFFFGMIAMFYFSLVTLRKMTPIVESLFGVKGVAGGSLIGATVMRHVKQGYGLVKTGADLTNSEKIQFKAPDAEKRKEVKDLQKVQKKEQKKADDLQYDAKAKDLIAKKMEAQAGSKTATEKEKKMATQARQEANEAQKLAEAQQKKAQELQNKVTIAQKEADALRFPSSQSKFKARRYVDDFMSEAHYGMQRDAERFEKIGVKTGQLLNKTGIGAVVGVPLIVGTKAISMAWRAPTKAASMAVHGATALASGGAHSYNWIKNKLTGKKK